MYNEYVELTKLKNLISSTLETSANVTFYLNTQKINYLVTEYNNQNSKIAAYHYRTSGPDTLSYSTFYLPNIDEYHTTSFLICYTNILKSTKKLHKESMNLRFDTIKSTLRTLDRIIDLHLEILSCPQRARNYVNADQSWIYHSAKASVHLFYRPQGTKIEYLKVGINNGITKSSDQRTGKYFLHSDIAKSVWPEDGL